MTLFKRIISILIMIFSVPILSGCWNYREIDSLQIVAGVAVDKGKNGTGYHITCDIVDTHGGHSQQATAKSMIIESDGETIFDAIRNAVKVSDKKLYFSDCQILIISQDIARESIAPVLDFFSRDDEPRIDIDLLVSKEDTAQKVIVSKGLTNHIVSFGIDKEVLNNKHYLSKSPHIPLYMANNYLSGNGISLVLPVLHLANNMETPVTKLEGTALFKKDKLVGFLNESESRLFLIITNRVKGGLYPVKEEGSAPDISLEINSNKAIITPAYNSDTPSMKISIQMQCDIGELETVTDYGTADGIKKIELDAAKQLENEIKELITAVQTQYDSDIFGFGNRIYQDNLDYWNKVKADWDSIFKTLDVDVTAKVNIRDTSTIKSKITIGD